MRRGWRASSASSAVAENAAAPAAIRREIGPMFFSHCSEPSITLSHYRALGSAEAAGQLPSAAQGSRCSHWPIAECGRARPIGGAKQPHPRGKQEQNRASDRAEHLRDEVGGALRTIERVSTAGCAQAVIRSAAPCGGRSRMHRRHMTVGLEAPARGGRLLPGERAGDDEAESDAAVDLAAAAAHSRASSLRQQAWSLARPRQPQWMRGRQHRHCGSTVQFRCAVLKRKPSEQQLYSAAPRVQSGTRKDHYRDAERQRDQQRPHRPQSARVVEKRAGRVRIVLRQSLANVAFSRTAAMRACACARLSADAQGALRLSACCAVNSSGGDGIVRRRCRSR